VEPDFRGAPLDALHAAYLNLTAKIEANVISLDEALRQLQDEEVVDAAGHTWRMDPVTQSFVRRAPGAGTSWKLADPSQYAYQIPQETSEARQPPPAAATAPGNRTTEPASDVETSAEGPGGRRLIVAAVALSVVVIAGVAGGLGGRWHSAAAAPQAAVPLAAAAPHASPTVTQQAPQLSKLELTRYQPTALKAVPAPQQVVLTWRLPPGARLDGAGIIIRRQPAAGAGITVLSPTDGRLPETYVAVPLEPGRQYCFMVGVLLQKVGGGTTLAESGPVCAGPR
jgi:hypothetical protein